MGYRPTQHTLEEEGRGEGAVVRCIFIKLCINRAVLCQFQPFLQRSFTLISLKERTAQSAILSVRSERFALCLKERHRSQNQGSLKSEERKSDMPSSASGVCCVV